MASPQTTNPVKARRSSLSSLCRRVGDPSKRFIVIGAGPGLEMLKISSQQRQSVGLADFGLNHVSLYSDDVQGSRDLLVTAGR